MRVLVTGGLGFVGQAVSRRLLAGGLEVAVMTSSSPSPLRPVPSGCDLVVADLLDADAVARAVQDVDAVCHLAALTRVRDSAVDPVRYFDVNVGGTLNLLRALTRPVRAVPPALVFCSTGAVYGPREGVISETDPVAPANAYGASKLAAEQAITHATATGALRSVVLRCFNVAGAVDGLGDPDLTRIIPKTLSVAAGEGMLTINGDGSAVREYTHVMDVAEAFWQALDAAHPAGTGVFNVGSGVGVTLAEVVAAAEKVTGREVKREHQPPKPEAKVLMADSSRIRRGVGWEPERSSLETILSDGWAARS